MLTVSLMGAPYETEAGLQSPLIQTGLSLEGSRLNSLVLMTDPERTEDLLGLAEAMPPQSAIIYRHFGMPGLEEDLRSITANRSIQLLIGNDPELAVSCGADGVHFSRNTSVNVIEHWRRQHPDWIISAAATKPPHVSEASPFLDALFVSSIFSSQSPSSGTPIGVGALRDFTAVSLCPVFALGGITDQNAKSLSDTGISGLAAISGLKEALKTSPNRADIRKTGPMMKAPNTTVDPIETRSAQAVSISKEEKGDLIVFTADVSGEKETGELTLRRIADRLWNANHTGVPSAIGGRGVGKALVQAMVEDARQTGYKVVPGCPFVAKLFERRPEWAEGVQA